MRIPTLLLIATVPLLSGCLAKTAFDIATLPVKAAGAAADLATTSQSEADEKRGREIRKREERLGKLDRRYTKQREQCADGSKKACEEAQDTYDEMQDLIASAPAKPGTR